MLKSAFLVGICCLLGFVGIGCGGPVDETQPIEGEQLSMMEGQPEPDTFDTLAKGDSNATAIFNSPINKDEQNAIVNHINTLIQSADVGSEISVTMYVFKDVSVAHALVAAHDQRQVRVRVVLDHMSLEKSAGNQAAYNALKAGLVGPGSYVKVCDKDEACVSKSKGINHNKFYLFSSIGKSKVVVQSSANLTSVNRTGYWNNAVTLVGNEDIYKEYLKYFNELSKGKHNRLAYNHVKTSGHTALFLFPYERDHADPVDHYILKEIQCTGNSSAYGDGKGHTVIRISAFWFTDRRKKLAETLRSLADKKCSIEIVYNDRYKEKGKEEKKKIGAEVKKLLQHERIKLAHFDKADGARVIVHSKYLLIDGSYNGRKNTKWVFTGSHNWDEASLSKNDESLLKIKSDTLHDAYKSNFEAMWNSAVKDAAH